MDKCSKNLKILKDLLKTLALVDQPFIGLYKFLKKYPVLKNSSLSSHYFRNDFKIIKTVCTSNEELFTYKKNCKNGFINHYFL